VPSPIPETGKSTMVAVPKHTYPPSGSPASTVRERPVPPSSTSWSIGVPYFLKSTGRRISNTTADTETSGVTEVLSARSISSSGSRGLSGGELAFSVLETPGVNFEPEMLDKFRTAFAFDDKEELLGCKSCIFYFSYSIASTWSDFPGYIYRLLPVHGRLYVSTNYFCFKSSGALASRTWVCGLQGGSGYL
jgi:sterol 3beta-glucosyltransferase